ncbi:RHS repeat-associated core domain-containing protein [Streptomyces sioyaensis]|uniref:RHS repeat-associated core domain-containing protein n=1 Tax=Streptomyces sioyaensis TaxID=67364 RepID=UPI003669D610
MTNPIVKALEHGAAKLGKTLGKDAGKAVQDLYHGAGHRLKKVATNHHENDKGLADHFDGIGKGDKPSPKSPNIGGTGTSRGKSNGGRKGSTTLRKGAGDGVQTSKPMGNRCKGGDPIDMVSGEMLLSETDVELPALLQLVIERTHISSYRCGRVFGRSWASTLDQRLEADDNGLVFATADGMMLVYPVPRPGLPTLPDHGPQWPLHWDGTPGGEICITDPATGHTLHFDPAPLSTGAPAGVMTLPLQTVSDRNGHRIDIFWDDDGMPVELKHSGGYRIAVDADEHRVLALRLLDTEDGPDGTTLSTYSYDVHGDLVEVTDGSDRAVRFVYDGNGRVIERVDRNGGWYRWEYDSADRCIRGIGADGYLSCTIEYDTDNRANRYTNSLGHTTTYRYNEKWQLTGWTDAQGNTTHQTWDSQLRLIAATNALGHTTHYGYDDAGNITSVIRPDGHSITTVYNELALPVEVTEVDGATWRYTYDDRGNRLSIVNPTGATTHFAYDENGCPASVTDALGHTVRISTNKAGLPLTRTNALGQPTTADRDAFGRVHTVRDALGRTERYGWTVQSKPAWRETADGILETWEWDGEGNLTAHTDRIGNTDRYTFNHFHKPSSRTTSDGIQYTFGYDTELRLTTVTDPKSLNWEYEYDTAGRLIRETDFAARTLLYRPDPTGQLAARTNGAGETTTFIRDVLGRPVEEHSTDGIRSFEYDLAGCVLRATNATTTVTHEYDALGRKLSETVNGRTTMWTYDLLGRRTQRRTPSGTVSTWTYDAVGRPATLDAAGNQLTFTFDDANQEIFRSLAPGLALTQQWDHSGRLSTQNISADGRPDAHPLQHRQYAYRPDGFVHEVKELTGTSRRFDLTQDGHVTAVQGQGWTETYAYDAAGNLTAARTPADSPTEQDPSTTGPTRDFAGNRLRRSGRTSYTYDTQGRLIRRDTRLLNGQTRTGTYTWNADDRLTGVVTPDGTRWRYEYDTAGRRTAKQRLASDGSVAEEITFTWDGTRLAEQATTSGAVTSWDYASGTHRPLTQVDRAPATGNDLRFHAVVTDVSGAPAELVTADGHLAWSMRTTVWGTPLPQSAQDAEVDCPLRFPGQYADTETGWHYNYFRHYDPDTARYLSPDPLGLAPAPNDYAYVTNPFTSSDPLGLFPSINGRGGLWERDPNTPPFQGHNRDSEFPSGYRQSTHDVMTARWTTQGIEQGGTPVYQDGPHKGQRIPRHELDWFNSRGETIPSDPKILTYEHLHPCVDYYNETGYNTDRATRNDFYNDVDNLEPMTRSENSSAQHPNYRQDTGPNYSCS